MLERAHSATASPSVQRSRTGEVLRLFACAPSVLRNASSYMRDLRHYWRGTLVAAPLGFSKVASMLQLAAVSNSERTSQSPQN